MACKSTKASLLIRSEAFLCLKFELAIS